MLKVSVLDTSIYGLSTGVDPDLVRWKVQFQTVPPSIKLRQDLRPNKDLIYVKKDVIISHLSFGGPLPLTDLHREVALLETVQDLDKALAISMERSLLDLVSIGIPLVDQGLPLP